MSTSPSLSDGQADLAQLQWIPQTSHIAIDRQRESFEEASDKYASCTMSTKKKAKRKEDGPLEIVCGWIVQHQIGLSLNLLTLLFLTHLCFPRARTHTRKFFDLSYYNPETEKYRLGSNDAWLVSCYVVFFTGLRAAVMDYILAPLAQMGGIKKAKDQTRFSEQAWLLIYYSVFWPIGMYIYINSEYFLNLQNLWSGFPDREMGGLLKWYMLAQYAFWVQQLMVIHIEKRRKDHWQMLAHHVVTTLLIFASYHYHQVRVANLILCIMDVVDLFFPTAKCLKYLGYTRACDCMFGLFMFTWMIARHVIFITVLYSVYAHCNVVIPSGCYSGTMGSLTGPTPPPTGLSYLLEPFYNPTGMVCWTVPIKWVFLTALLFLQGLTLVWFSMILRVAVKVLQGGTADDTRSDDEDETEETISPPSTPILEKVEAQPFEEEVGVESLNLKGRTSKRSNARKNAGGSSSGVNLTADRVNLLDRIGCETKISKN